MNYQETFITVAPDCPVEESVVPTMRGQKKSIHLIQYELLTQNPYTFTGQELIFETHVRRLGLSDAEIEKRRNEIWEELFAKPHACLRASALPKKYGWGFHYDTDGKIGIYALESDAYQKFSTDDHINQLAAMRSKRVK